jgi:hypothetical protein
MGEEPLQRFLSEVLPAHLRTKGADRTERMADVTGERNLGITIVAGLYLDDGVEAGEERGVLLGGYVYGQTGVPVVLLVATELGGHVALHVSGSPDGDLEVGCDVLATPQDAADIRERRRQRGRQVDVTPHASPFA